MDKIVEARERFLRRPARGAQGRDRALRSGALHHRRPASWTTSCSAASATTRPDGPERIRTIVREILDELDLYDDVLDVGLGFNVGVGGRRLTAAQRQKLDVARALLKRADYLIFNRPLLGARPAAAGADPAQRARGSAPRTAATPAIIWVLTNPAMAQFFDRVMVFDAR